MRCRAALQVSSETGSAREVAECLGLEPTASFERGDRWGRDQERVRDHALWELGTDMREPSELSDLLAGVLLEIEPRTDRLRALLTDGYSARWWCYVEAGALEHAVELPAGLLARLASLGADLLIDTYPDDAE